MNKRNIQWDRFIHETLIRIVTAERQYDYFILQQLDSKSIYDLLFTRLALIAATFVRKTHVYAEPYGGLFKFLKFKWKERPLRRLPLSCAEHLASSEAHNCNAEERKMLLTEVAKNYDITEEEMVKIYKEYYGK